MQLFAIVEKWNNVLYWSYNCVAYLRFLFLGKKEKQIIKKNKRLENTFSGERCFLVLNGPSIRKHDLTQLKDEYVFCTNYFFMSELSSKIIPNFFCWLDSKDIATRKDIDIKDYILKRYPDGKLVFNIKGYNDSDIDNDNLFYTYNKHLPYQGHIRGNLSGICSGFKNVAFYAINVAIYMGFKQIYILGMDFEPSGFIHFEKIGGEQQKLNSRDNRHLICDHYWGYGQAHIEAFALAEYAKKHNVYVINLNKESYIRSFEFAEFETII